MLIKYKYIKIIVIILALLLLILLTIFTIDVINDEPNWAWFQINYDNSKVANYGALMSGILSFLAIVFVIFGIAEQRESVQQEKKKRQEEEEKIFTNRLKLLKSLLYNVTDEIKEQGKRMETYYKIELEYPTQPNITHFSANKSFKRILEMDYLKNYEAIQFFFSESEDWDKMFLNLNSNVDFYSEALIELRQKYENHILDKVNRHKDIAKFCEEFLDSCVKIIEKYRVENVQDYLTKEWVVLLNGFIEPYYNYIDVCKNNAEPTNFRVLSDNYFLPFLREGMKIRNRNGFDDYGSEEQVALASKIRKRIYEIEMYSVQYAENIKYYYEEYFNEESESFKNFKSIASKISSKLDQMT